MTLLVATLVALNTGGCAGSNEMPEARYSMPPSPPQHTESASLFAPVRIDAIDVAARGDVAAGDPSRPARGEEAVYRSDLWSAPPADLIAARLRRDLQPTMMHGGDSHPVLQVVLTQFDTVTTGMFGGYAEIRGSVCMTGLQSDADRTIITARAPMVSRDANGAIVALSLAAAEFVAQTEAWVGIEAANSKLSP